MNTNTYVIVPFYNEASTLRSVVGELKTQFKNVICVDDGSTDGSAESISDLDAILLRFPFNLGKGAALQAALEYCLDTHDAEYLLTFDADGQHQLKDAMALVKRIERGDVDVVLGSRFLTNRDAAEVPMFKRVMLRAAASANNSVSAIRLTDTHNGLRVFTRDAAQMLELTHPGFSYASEIVDRISHHKMRCAEIPVTILYTDYSRSKGQPMLNSINIIFDLLIHRTKRR